MLLIGKLLRNKCAFLFGHVKSVIVIHNCSHLSVCPITQPVQLLPTNLAATREAPHNNRAAAHQHQ